MIQTDNGKIISYDIKEVDNKGFKRILQFFGIVQKRKIKTNVNIQYKFGYIPFEITKAPVDIRHNK